MKNVEVKGLLSQLRDAASAIKSQIQEADNEIAVLNSQRRALMDAPVSKSDFMAYVRADIQVRAASYDAKLGKWARNNKFPFSFSQLERVYLAESLQPFPYLDGEVPHNAGDIDPGALYWHFGELIAERFSDALDRFEWDDDLVAVADRRNQIAAIDTNLKQLNAHRDQLASDLIGSGMYE